MYYQVILLLLLGAFTVGPHANLCTAALTETFRRICFFTNWAQYRPGAGRFTPKDIDTSLCSHIHYAFAKIQGNTLAPSEPTDLPSNNGEGMYQEVINLKTVSPSLKVILSVGGYMAGNGPFSAIASSRSNREAFNTQAISYLRKYRFDGLDIDWEYPLSKDKINFVTWVQELREAFDKEGRTNAHGTLILACAVAAGKHNIDSGYDVKRLANYMDYITVMTYDLHGYWDKIVGPNAPLHAADYETGYYQQLNVEWAMNYLLSKGVRCEKFNMGLATYGRSFTLNSTGNSQPGSPSRGPAPPGKYTREEGFLAYYEICEMKDSAQYHWMNDSMVPYIVKDSTWVGYDNVKSFRLKIQWLKSKLLGGYAIWSVDLDDFNDICKNGKYPLLKILSEELGPTM